VEDWATASYGHSKLVRVLSSPTISKAAVAHSLPRFIDPHELS